MVEQLGHMRCGRRPLCRRESIDNRATWDFEVYPRLHPPRCKVNSMPTSTMVEMLTPIWRRVLQLSSVDVEDNFFDLGGDSSLALQLFNEVAHACGRELPPVTIYVAPTIAALAAVLEQPADLRFPTLVLLKNGPK